MNLVCALLLLFNPVSHPDDTVSRLRPWPEAGPPVVFSVNGIGNGYSSPAVTDNRIFITGEKDKTGYLYSFDLLGKPLWEKSYGEEFTTSFPGSRAAPVVVDNQVYIVSGTAEIYCFDSETGEQKWKVSMTKDLQGINPIFGYSMKLLVDGEKLFCSPSGEKNNIVALNRHTGELIWSSPGKGEPAGYGAPLVINHPARKILVTASEFNILGLDAETGELLWTYELAFKGDIPCNTPIYDGNKLYWVAGPGNGAVAATLTADGKGIHVEWKNMEFDTSFGDFVRIGNYLYGSSETKRNYVSVDCEKGKTRKSVPFGIGSVIRSGENLIAYNQRGQIGLIEVDQDKLDLVSVFRITEGTQEHFSHPVVFGNRLFVRHGDTLVCYDIGSPE